MIHICCGDKEFVLEYPGAPVKIAELLVQCGLRQEQPCGGRGKCGKCTVKAVGAFCAVTEDEYAALSAAALAEGVRLACCAEITGDSAEILLTDNLEFAGLADAGEMQMQMLPMGCGLGLAVDIGTTTVAAYLCDLTSGCVLCSDAAPNPQRAFGADVVSRIDASLAGHGVELAELVRTCIAGLAESLATAVDRDVKEIDAAVITGNTAMLYMLMEFPVDDIAVAPFEAVHRFGTYVPGAELFPEWATDCTIYLPPCISAYVGADVTCGIFSSGMLGEAGPVLLADIGTNGEMALYAGGRLLCCSTAAGPALEGVGIQMGSCAVQGAIDRVWLAEGAILIHTIGEAKARSICGSGLLDAVTCLLETGEIDETGALQGNCIQLGGTEVLLTQKDIRSVQLAKAAIRAGMDTLLHYGGCAAPQKLLLAGGFGSLMNPVSASKIGLIPPESATCMALGNSAGRGAVQLLLNRTMHAQCEDIAAVAQTVGLAADPFFSAAFVDRMGFEGE